MIYDNHKVIIFHLLNYTSPLILKLHGKMKQTLALLWSKINAKNRAFVVSYHKSWQHIAIRCVVTVNYGHFLCRHNSRIVAKRIKSKRLCQGIKHCFAMCISFGGIQNCYKEIDIIRSLFYRCLICTEWHMIMVGDKDCKWR